MDFPFAICIDIDTVVARAPVHCVRRDHPSFSLYVEPLSLAWRRRTGMKRRVIQVLRLPGEVESGSVRPARPPCGSGPPVIFAAFRTAAGEAAKHGGAVMLRRSKVLEQGPDEMIPPAWAAKSRAQADRHARLPGASRTRSMGPLPPPRRMWNMVPIPCEHISKFDYLDLWDDFAVGPIRGGVRPLLTHVAGDFADSTT